MKYRREEKEMKLILAGFSKSGTKSSTAALEILGFKVADLMEQAEWTDSNCTVWHNLYSTVCISPSKSLDLIGGSI